MTGRTGSMFRVPSSGCHATPETNSTEDTRTPSLPLPPPRACPGLDPGGRDGWRGAPRTPIEPYKLNLRGPSTAHALVLKLVGRGKSVLEIGPASGYLSRCFVEAGCSVTVIEVDEALARCAQQPGVKVICGSIEDEEVLREIRDTFDVVVLADVLEHLRQPEQSLRRMRDFLNPGGYIVVSLPNIGNWRIRARLLFGRFDYADTGILDRTHLRFFTKRSAEAMIREAGYEVLAFHAGATRMPALLVEAWPTLCAVHLVFKIAPREHGP